jgi:cyclopropane fatty-acyl-phospholipid synthase-like methyltransferase
MLDQQHSEIVAINKTKGHDYAGEEDALSNFKRNADRLGLTPIQVWGVYFHKHLDAIETYVREGGVPSEPIEGRIQDAILYLYLLRGLISEGTVGG